MKTVWSYLGMGAVIWIVCGLTTWLLAGGELLLTGCLCWGPVGLACLVYAQIFAWWKL
uniref:Uncharacterized protein n=1 Tax=viral metagenome TaxID=1070528 RepID=A0A6M3LN78_9ZZZZ